MQLSENSAEILRDTSHKTEKNGFNFFAVYR